MSGEELSEVELLRQQLHNTQARAEAAEERSDTLRFPNPWSFVTSFSRNLFACRLMGR